MNTNKIFVGGFGGVGSRFLMDIFEKLGLYVGRGFSNPMHDFGGHDNQGFVTFFNECYIHNDFTLLFKYIERNLQNPNDFAIKHGQLMYVFPQLKKYFKGSKTVYIMRNPVDNALNPNYNPQFYYGGITENSLDVKIQYYIDESIKACKNADLVVKYEDLCSNLELEIIKLAKFTGLAPCTVSSVVDLKPSTNIGIGKDLYSKFDLSQLGY